MYKTFRWSRRSVSCHAFSQLSYGSDAAVSSKATVFGSISIIIVTLTEAKEKRKIEEYVGELWRKNQIANFE
jgi:hypothetical protein